MTRRQARHAGNAQKRLGRQTKGFELMRVCGLRVERLASRAGRPCHCDRRLTFIGKDPVAVPMIATPQQTG
jgi:hypothetical protein